MARADEAKIPVMACKNSDNGGGIIKDKLEIKAPPVGPTAVLNAATANAIGKRITVTIKEVSI